MSQPIDETVENLLAERDEDGRVVVRVGLIATLYFENAHLPEVRDAVAACFEGYQSLCGAYLRWAKHPETFIWNPADSPDVPTPRSWLKNLDKDLSWEFDFQGGESPEEASHFRVEALGSAEWRQRPSYFRAVLPMTWFADHPGSFPSFVQEFCERLQCLSGYGGLGILESPDGLIQQKFEPAVFALAERFPGLEVDHPITHILYLTEGIKGVNWLTVIGDQWLSRIGGEESLREKLPEQFIFHPISGGLLIQAGAKPQLGDLERGTFPELYAQLAAHLSSIRIKKHRSFQHAGPERFNRETSEKWLARLEEFGE